MSHQLPHQGEQYPSYSLAQFLAGVGGVRRTQALAGDQGPSRSPGPTVPGQGGYLLLLRGSPTEPRVLLHKAGILILGFSQLQFLRDQRNSRERARYPHSSPPHTEDPALPDKAFLPHLEPCISQERRAPQHRRESVFLRTRGMKAEVRGNPSPGRPRGSGVLASGRPSRAHQLLISPLPFSGFLLQALTFLPLPAEL